MSLDQCAPISNQYLLTLTAVKIVTKMEHVNTLYTKIAKVQEVLFLIYKQCGRLKW